MKPEPFGAVSRRVRDGDILLCSGNDPFSRLISWSTKSPWTHVALAYRWPALGRIMVFESVQQLGVRTVPLSKFISQSSTGQKPYPGKIILARHEDYADKAEYAMEEVKDHGGDVADSEILDAQKDEANLEWADYHQEIADDAATTAASYAESGDTDAAAVYAETASSEATVAGDYGASADQGGTYADQTVDTSSTFDATATASTVADTSSVSTVDTSTTTTE